MLAIPMLAITLLSASGVGPPFRLPTHGTPLQNVPQRHVAHAGPLTSADLYGVAFNTPLHGFISGSNGTFMETADGGKSWALRTLPLANGDDPLYAVRFANQRRAFVLGNSTTNGPDIFRTRDAGMTWKKILSFPLGGSWYAVDFVSRRAGFMGANGALATTTDGGTSWTLVPNSDPPVTFGMSFLDENVGLLAGETIYTDQLGVFKTADGGLHWTNVLSPGPGGTNDVIFLGKRVALAGNAGFYRSNDAGDTWQTVAQAGNDGISRFAQASANRVVAVTLQGGVWVSLDAGRTWAQTRKVFAGLPARWDICFVDDQHGWIVGPSGAILASKDGGATWKEL
jgi:photosystem II stability/assembly factor-like uncharacterized protein